MSRTTNIRRAASVLGATGLVALSMAGPASARPDPGSGSPEDWHCTSACYLGGAVADDPVPRPVLRVDDGGIQVLQLGAGVLAGAALAGAGMAVVSRRNHAHEDAVRPA
jgi:hypothetical protein